METEKELEEAFDELAGAITDIFRIQYLFEACQLVCESCEHIDKNPHVDKTKQTHYETNSNGVRHMVPCKAAKIHKAMNI
jgi:hypothetical protein